MSDPAAARHAAWRYGRAKITTLPKAAAWLEHVGFALLFASDKVPLPALWAVATDDDDGWGPDAERVWGWKDELPRRGLAWYGPFLRGRKGFLAPSLLRDLYPRAGEPDDYLDSPLSRDARRIADVILASGPTSLAVLREATGLLGKRSNAPFAAALKELGRALVVTHHGVEDQGAGWPSAVMELTARAFDVRSGDDAATRRARAARRYLATMIEAKPGELARTFNWTTDEARAALRG